MPKLARLVGRIAVQEYELRDGSQFIGRSVDSDIYLYDKMVSEVHAEVTVKPSPYMVGHKDVFIKDSGSKNGVFVNGDKTSQHRLKSGDKITIGSQVLKFIDDDRTTGEQRIVSKPD